MRPIHPNHIWAIDFVHDKLSNGRSYKMLTVLDEYTREALCVAVRPKMNATDVLDVMHRLVMKHGKPEFIRSDNGPEFIAAQLQDWLRRVGINPMQIYPGSPLLWFASKPLPGSAWEKRIQRTVQRNTPSRSP
ncbi:MAG: DDE-type integrase/transposase/recombinase [Pseudomonadota bacterium]